jgi:hypothetical protein
MILPAVRYMLVCDEVLQAASTGKLTIVGLTSAIHWPAASAEALRLDKLVVLLVLTDGRGKGKSQVVCYY